MIIPPLQDFPQIKRLDFKYLVKLHKIVLIADIILWVFLKRKGNLHGAT